MEYLQRPLTQMNHAALKANLDRLLVLLREYNEPHWHAFFQEASELLAAGKIRQAKKKIRSAYGGMCSFSDALYFTGAPKEIVDEGYALRSLLYVLSERDDSDGLLPRF